MLVASVELHELISHYADLSAPIFHQSGHIAITQPDKVTLALITSHIDKNSYLAIVTRCGQNAPTHVPFHTACLAGGGVELNSLILLRSNTHVTQPTQVQA